MLYLMLVFILPLRKGLATPSCLPRPYSRVYSLSRVFAWHMPRMKYSTMDSSNWQMVHRLSTELMEQVASPHLPLLPTPVC